jgi:hypothetical protein
MAEKEGERQAEGPDQQPKSGTRGPQTDRTIPARAKAKARSLLSAIRPDRRIERTSDTTACALSISADTRLF